MDRPNTEAYLKVMQQCAAHLGRQLADVDERHLQTRLVETDAALIIRGLGDGLLRVEGNYLRTLDPRQATAWLVEGAPARLCWEYVPHAAGYVELISDLSYPPGSVRFETPESEARMSLDLVVLDHAGRAIVLGEVKREARQIRELARLLTDHRADPGKPGTVASGGPQGAAREAWKLAHQLWRCRAPWLWLVAAGERAAYRVTYDDGLTLTRTESLPSADEHAVLLATKWPVITLP